MSRHRQAGKSFSTDGGRHMKIGLQLYTLRGNIKNGDDLLKILSDVKKLGFEGVEFAGYFGLDANTLRSRLDELVQRIGRQQPFAHIGAAKGNGKRIEQPACLHSKPASMKILSRPSFSACILTGTEPGTTMALTPS